MQFPVFNTKVKGLKKAFDLNNPRERRDYFDLKAGQEIKNLRNYFKRGNTFIAYLVGKKNSGKGTYAKMFAEIVGPQYVEHFSIGDMIRGVDEELKDKKKKKELLAFLEKNYRGRSSIKELLSLLEKRSTSAPLLPTELILALIKREIAKKKKKTLFIDGFPRDLDQMNFTLFFRDLIDYRQDPDLFSLIDVPETVIDERIKYRRVCPRCQSVRNLKLHPVAKQNIRYDNKNKKFYFVCDNLACRGQEMVSKEGDERGTKPIKARNTVWFTVKIRIASAAAIGTNNAMKHKGSPADFAAAIQIPIITAVTIKLATTATGNCNAPGSISAIGILWEDSPIALDLFCFFEIVS